MKEQVTDIPKVLKDMTAEMRLMRETINQQYEEIAKLNRSIEVLPKLSTEIQKFKKQLKERYNGTVVIRERQYKCDI